MMRQRLDVREGGGGGGRASANMFNSLKCNGFSSEKLKSFCHFLQVGMSSLQNHSGQLC